MWWMLLDTGDTRVFQIGWLLSRSCVMSSGVLDQPLRDCGSGSVLSHADVVVVIQHLAQTKSFMQVTLVQENNVDSSFMLGSIKYRGNVTGG